MGMCVNVFKNSKEEKRREELTRLFASLVSKAAKEDVRRAVAETKDQSA